MKELKGIRNRDYYKELDDDFVIVELQREIMYYHKGYEGKTFAMDDVILMYKEGIISEECFNSLYEWFESYIEEYACKRIKSILGDIVVPLNLYTYTSLLYWIEKGWCYLECTEENVLCRIYFYEPKHLEHYNYYCLSEANIKGVHPVIYTSEYDMNDKCKKVIKYNPDSIPYYYKYVLLDLETDTIIDFLGDDGPYEYAFRFRYILIPLDNDKIRNYEITFKQQHMNALEWDKIYQSMMMFVSSNNPDEMYEKYLEYTPLNPLLIKELTLDNVRNVISYAIIQPHAVEEIEKLIKEWF